MSNIEQGTKEAIAIMKTIAFYYVATLHINIHIKKIHITPKKVLNCLLISLTN